MAHMIPETAPATWRPPVPAVRSTPLPGGTGHTSRGVALARLYRHPQVRRKRFPIHAGTRGAAGLRCS
jgi:hypothetical protein